jgi:MATE family multidrug resistance protein
MQRALRELRPTLSLAVPIIIGQVCQILMGVTDSMMIGHAGTVPLAASAFGGNVFNVFYVLGIGLMLPVSIFVSRAHGAKSPEECGEYLRHGLALALGFGVVETALMAGLSFAMGFFRQPPEVVAIVNPFFGLIATSLTPVLVYLVLRQFAEALGRPWLPMLVMLAGVGLNAFLNWIFIFGHLGMPALGLTGAGVSTLISRALGAAVILVWLRFLPDAEIRKAWPVRWSRPLSWDRLKQMLHLGLPSSGMLLFESSAFAFSSIMIGWLGAIQLAAHQIALTCASLSFMFPLGLSMAAGMRVSRAVGAHEHDRRRPIALSAQLTAFGMMSVFAAVFSSFGRTIAGWFVTDTAVIAVAIELLVVVAIFQIADGTQVISAAALRGITDVKVPAAITFAAYWIVALPLGWLLGIHGPFGAVGVWSGVACGLAFAAIALSVRFVRLTK